MKLSISWIFDHINSDWKKHDIKELVNKFNQITAETEHFEKITFNPNNFILVRAKESDHKFEFINLDNNKKIELPHRTDILNDNIYLVAKDNKTYRWATLVDLNSEKDGLLTNLYFQDPKDLSGNWRNLLETEDYILTVDNKSITNRPDMWGHKGFAREIASILDLKLYPEEKFIVNLPIKHYEQESSISSDNPYIFKSQDLNICKRFAGLYFDKIENKPSSLFIAHRLARVDARPIDFIVDATNYVMLDSSQPMHAFDAKKIKSKIISAQFSHDNQTLDLLDNTQVKLSSKDLVICDDITPISLAGIMGGKATSVSKDTDSIILESANFDASTIRNSSLRTKKRTESSARFEKSLDPNQNTYAIMRYLRLLQDYNINYSSSNNISSVGKLAQEKTITINHDLIISRIGVIVSQDLILGILNKLGFGVRVMKENSYQVTVPTNRSTKDVTFKEDIIEEIARFFGYTNISHQLPLRSMNSFDFSRINNKRKIKQYFANSMNLHEVYTYTLYDKEFNSKINYEITNNLSLLNPISENNIDLLTSLIPNLLKAVVSTDTKVENIRFFELNKTWLKNSDKIKENLRLSGIVADRKQPVDFYELKSELQRFFKFLSLEVKFEKAKNKLDVWFDPYQTAQIYSSNNLIGVCGKINSQWSSNFFEGDIFIFELDGDFLLNYIAPVNKFKALNKYPAVDLDVSMLIAQNIEVEQIQSIIKNADSKIKSVELVDHFYKPEWKDLKSITMRFKILDDSKTLNKSEIEQVYEAVVSDLVQIGAAIR